MNPNTLLDESISEQFVVVISLHSKLKSLNRGSQSAPEQPKIAREKANHYTIGFFLYVLDLQAFFTNR